MKSINISQLQVIRCVIEDLGIYTLSNEMHDLHGKLDSKTTIDMDLRVSSTLRFVLMNSYELDGNLIYL